MKKLMWMTTSVFFGLATVWMIQASTNGIKDIITGKWKEVKGKLKQQWGKLTDDDISKMEGSYDELEGILQKNYGYQKEQAKKEIDSFLDHNDWTE